MGAGGGGEGAIAYCQITSLGEIRFFFLSVYQSVGARLRKTKKTKKEKDDEDGHEDEDYEEGKRKEKKGKMDDEG